MATEFPGGYTPLARDVLVLGAPETGVGAMPISLPLHDLGSGAIYNSVTHPDVLYIPRGFAGYRYWMAVTPYPDTEREEPNVFASNDGVTWELPNGATHRVARRAEAIAALGAGSWLADNDLMYFDGTLFLFYCRFNAARDWQWVRRHSTDGRIWSPATVVLSGTTPTSHSPAFVWEGVANATAFYVKGLDSGTPTIHYRESSDLGVNWGAEQNCTFPKCTDDRPDFWHIDVVKVSDVYHALVLSKTTAESSLWYYTSRDKATWTLECHEPAIPYSGFPLLDGVGNYRSCLVPKEGGSFDIYVSCQPRGATGDDLNQWPDMAVTASTATDFFTATGGDHTFDDGDEVVLVSGTPPGNITIGTTYYVRDRTNNTFKVAATKGGVAIDLITTNGSNIRVTRHPWRIALLRDVELPVKPRVVAARTAFTNIRTGGAHVAPLASARSTAVSAWFAANWGVAHRFMIENTKRQRYFRIRIGTASGNIEVGVGRAHGVDHLTCYPIVSSGVIACPAAALVKIDLGSFTLPPGDYWMWFWADNATVTVPHTDFGGSDSGLSAAFNLAAAGGFALPKAGTTLAASGRTVGGMHLHGDY